MREASKSPIQPIVDYACVICGAASQYNLDRVLRLQKYLAKNIFNIKRPQAVPSSTWSFKLNWMTINQRIYILLYVHIDVQNYRPLSSNAETKDFARLTSHPVRGWTGKNKAVCSPGTQNDRRVIKVYYNASIFGPCKSSKTAPLVSSKR